ncbi:MAG: hypothetical protein DCC68_06490 [Planctomycetota bacterium]|nr:MAG: hypothetical protein DCC68_06490 [Planctomycetota bacterium]
MSPAVSAAAFRKLSRPSMRWPILSFRRTLRGPRCASPTNRRAAGRTLEALEPRQLLSATAGEHLTISNSQYLGFNRFEVALDKAADLSLYSSAELAAVREWIAFTPEFYQHIETEFGWRPELSIYRHANFVGPTAPGSSETTSTGTTSTGTTSTDTTLGGATATAASTTNISTPTSTPTSLPSSSLATVEPIDAITGAQLWRFPATADSQTAAAELRAAVGDGHFYPLVPHRIAKKLVPNDPYYPDQWHLDNRRQSNGTVGEDANVVEVWDDYRGTGVILGIVDDGIDYYHPDLASSYLDALSANYSGIPFDAGADPINGDFHGTAVAGVAAAPGNNGIGVSGVAPDARFASIRLIANANATDGQEGNSLRHALNQIDIYNNSWGPPDGVDWLLAPGPAALLAINAGTNTGRGGRGAIYTWAAGNGLADDDNVNFDGYANLINTLAVTAIDDRGEQTQYSEPGAAIFISANSSSTIAGTVDGVVTADLRGNQGYNYTVGGNDGDGFRDLNYTETFGGTSSAAPVVSGVVALMLEANPNLGWRDVYSILAETARKNDPTDNSWKTNAAGYDFSEKFGFGAVDALAAVRLAENWTPLGPFQQATTNRIFSGQLIPENSTGVTLTQAVADDLVNIEFVEVYVDINHAYGGDLEIVLTSPSGTRSTLATQHPDGTPYADWFMLSNAFRGETTQGEWKLTLYDRDQGTTGSITSWGMNIITGPDVAPVAVDDTAQTRPGVPVDVTVTANDANRPDVNTLAIVGGPSSGTAVVMPGGIIHYTPAAGFSGDATLQYTVQSQGGLVSNAATVTIVVNEPPTARPDTVTTPEDTVGTFNVATNDTDPDGTVVGSTVSITTPPANGLASVDSLGRIVYTPAANFFGSDALFYTIRDNRGGVSAPGAVTINVTPVNDPPTAVDDTAKGVGGVATVVNVVANDFDIDSTVDPATVQIVAPPASGTAIVNPNGTIAVTPPLGFAGLLTFTYAVRDNQGALSAPGTVHITTSAPPTTTPDSATINEDTTITIDVLFNDFDVDGTIVRSTLAIAQQPQHGTVTIDSSFRIRYVPEKDYFGVDTFGYTVRDNEGNTSAPGVVTITLIEVNDAPRGKLDAVGTEMDVGVVVDVLANDVDVDGTIQPSTLSIPVGGRPQHGQVTTDPVTGAIFYMPDPGYVGSDALTYLVRDEDGALSKETTVLLRVGRPVSLSGMVFADINNNGAFDAGEIGVPNTEVAAVMNAGLFQLTAIVRTEDDGTFRIVDRPSEGVVLPQGSYTLRQPQPVAFIDGQDTPGAPPPGATIDNACVSIALAEGQNAEDFLFAERGLKAEFVSAYLGRRLYFASAAPGGSLFGARHGRVFDLADGDVYFTFDSGAPERVTASATFDAANGNARLEVLDANLNILASASSTSGEVSVSFGPGPGPYILRASGAATNVFLTTDTVDTTPHVGAALSVRGSQWPAAVVDNLSTATGAQSGMSLAPASATGEGVLPWSNVDTISVRFDAPVSIGASGLRLASASGATYGVVGYLYDAATRTATWRLDRALAADNYVVSVAPSGTAVDFRLSTTAPSEARFSVLPGDVDGNGVANFLDAIAIRNNFAQPGQYSLNSPHFDLDANGAVDMADFVLAVRHGFARRAADEVSGLLVAASTTSTSGGSPAAEAVVRRANSAPHVAAAESLRTAMRRGRIAAIDASYDGSATSASTATLRASRARRIKDPGDII